MIPSPYMHYKKLNSSPYVIVVAVVFVFAAGTGGYPTPHCFSPRDTKSYGEEREASSAVVKAVSIRNEVVSTPSHVEDLKLVRDYFKPSVAQLAGSLGVERQTIYDWQAGKGISDERRETLRELASACSKLAEAGISAGDDILRRKISNGQTLLQLIASGTPAGEAVRLTVLILDTEKHERLLLAEHLNRRSSSMFDITDAGKPHLNEEG